MHLIYVNDGLRVVKLLQEITTRRKQKVQKTVNPAIEHEMRFCHKHPKFFQCKESYGAQMGRYDKQQKDSRQ